LRRTDGEGDGGTRRAWIDNGEKELNSETEAVKQYATS
jgi:hypothetical protein